MVTTVGTESTYPKLLQNLLLLEHDAIAAYDQTIQRLENENWKEQIARFKNDHDLHVQELSHLAKSIGAEAPTEGDAKQLLTTGKVALASIMGDTATLRAMKSNEEDTVTAYERAAQHTEAPAQALEVFRRALADELRHRAWMQSTADNSP
jgi:rubrerythrin